MYYAHPNSGERFYLRLLLTAIKGATSYQNLRTVMVNGQLEECATFREACLKLGLLEDDNEWIQCLEEAREMATGSVVCLSQFFVKMLLQILWHYGCNFMTNYVMICIMLYTMATSAVIQQKSRFLTMAYTSLTVCFKTLADWLTMPQPQEDWDALIGNRLIAEQRNYDMAQEEQVAAQRIPTLNAGQHSAFDLIVTAVMNKTGQSFFLHGPGGTGKTYVYNTLCHYFCGQGKIVLCAASSGIAALLLIGGRTAHSCFKIPIKIHESSTCSIGKHTDLAELICITDLVIWDEAPMQHRHNHEAVDHTFHDICNCDQPFGGLTVVFGGDFKQILPVVVKGSRAQIVGASLQRSVLWPSIEVLRLT